MHANLQPAECYAKNGESICIIYQLSVLASGVMQ